MTFAKSAFASLWFAASAGVAFAQGAPSGTAPGHSDPYAHDKFVTGTGATVANPGKSQSGGTTPLDRGIQQRDNQIDKGICKGC